MKKLMVAAVLGLVVWSILGAASEASKYPLTIKDESGYKIIIKSEPKRIISTMPSNTEIICALGLFNKLVGVTAGCNYPPRVSVRPKIGGPVLSYEKIAGLRPDLIVMLGDAQKADISRLRSYKFPVFVINPHTVKGVISSIKLLGKVTNSGPAEKNLIKDLEGRLKSIEWMPKTRNPKIFVVVWHKPLITAGKGTFIDDVIKIAGGINIAGSIAAPYPEFSIEKLMAENPDYIIIPEENFSIISQVFSDKNWAKLTAVQKDRVILISGDMLFRPAPRLINALEKIVKSIND